MAATIIDPEHKMDDPEFRFQFAACVLTKMSEILLRREGRELVSVEVTRLPEPGPKNDTSMA